MKEKAEWWRSLDDFSILISVLPDTYGDLRRENQYQGDLEGSRSDEIPGWRESIKRHDHGKPPVYITPARIVWSFVVHCRSVSDTWEIVSLSTLLIRDRYSPPSLMDQGAGL